MAKAVAEKYQKPLVRLGDKVSIAGRKSGMTIVGIAKSGVTLQDEWNPGDKLTIELQQFAQYAEASRVG